MEGVITYTSEQLRSLAEDIRENPYAPWSIHAIDALAKHYLALCNLAEAAEHFEREYQRQRGAVLSSDDYLMLNELQTAYLEAQKKLA